MQMYGLFQKPQSKKPFFSEKNSRAAQNIQNRRTRRLPSSHAETDIAARGDCHRRTRKMSPPVSPPLEKG